MWSERNGRIWTEDRELGGGGVCAAVCKVRLDSYDHPAVKSALDSSAFRTL